jgi:hypothetical protein
MTAIDLSKLKQEIEVKSNVESLELYSDNYPFSLSLRIANFESESDYKKFVKNCERLIRSAMEYKLWKNYIIDVLQINECMITHEKIDEVTIQVHHHVPSLYILVSALVNKRIENNEKFCTFDIAEEAISLHFQNKIGYITLLTSMHEKFHNGKLGIPISLVKGDYRYFMNNYSKYLDDADLERLEERLAVNESNCTWSKDNYPVAAEG